MLVEVKAKVARIIDGKTRKRVETFLVPDCDVFTNAEYIVLNALVNEQEEGIVDSSEIPVPGRVCIQCITHGHLP